MGLIDRIEKELGLPGLVQKLASDLAPTDLTSLLLEVYRQQAHRRSAAQVLAEYQQNRFVKPAQVSPRQLLNWETTLFDTLPEEVEVLDLSPVTPLGTCSVVAGVDQNWSVSTVRGMEVVSDATNVLALEAAARRQTLRKAHPKSREVVRLGASHRLLRPQIPFIPGVSTHFNLFCMVSAGRDLGSRGFEFQHVLQHLQVQLRALRAFVSPELALKVKVTDFHRDTQPDRIKTDILDVLQTAFSNLVCEVDPHRIGGKGYYSGLCFYVFALMPDGNELNLSDGGEVPWGQRLLSNQKERMVISGLSGERSAGLLF
ncbi:hypothetical protein [Deinococcus misasensis]|uniref:hypothetical protein n=1 Tax=Deinococcus misasensis TaxID=392413 RepID=UPI00054E098E|nr:hypothetical protein [Deinococcus misasensis]